jgi:hypothetical protein
MVLFKVIFVHFSKSKEMVLFKVIFVHLSKSKFCSPDHRSPGPQHFTPVFTLPPHSCIPAAPCFSSLITAQIN